SAFTAPPASPPEKSSEPEVTKDEAAILQQASQKAEINPLYTFYAAVFRTHHDGSPQGGFQMENALSREDALRSMTIWAAKGSFDEGTRGSLEKDKFADFVILDTDLMKASSGQVLDADVIGTWVQGEKMY
ncbi:MAG: amidohydrolase family protein, partial [Bacteroidales bacterium]